MILEIICHDLKKNIKLSDYTTIGVGGPAKYFLNISATSQLSDALLWANSQALPVFVLGGGSNLLVSDQGFSGLVLHLQMKQRNVTEMQDHVLVTVGAGYVWDDLVAWSCGQNLVGIECLSGIPGHVGAAPIQNIGAYGQELADSLVEVKAFDRHTMDGVSLSKEACQFGYRDSIFKSQERDRYIITEICLKLQKNANPVAKYPELQKNIPENASAQVFRDTVLRLRRGKGMVVDATDPNSRSCGSFFTNPMISEAAYQDFLLREPGAHPAWQLADERVKLSAAWLIDHSGFHKGYVKAQAGLSEKHCLALINRGNATARDLHALAQEIQSGVHQRFGISLDPEPIFL